MMTFFGTFRSVLVNDFARARTQAVASAVLMAATLVSMGLGLYMHETQHPMAHVAYVTQDAAQAPASSEELDVVVVDRKPAESLLVKQRYDAYVTPREDGGFDIDTLRGDDFKTAIGALVADPSLPVDLGQSQGGPGYQMIGFMMLFLLMGSFGGLFVFSQDKEEGQLARISVAPVSLAGYLAAHCICCLVNVVPEIALLAVFQALGHDIGFTLLQYVGLVSALTLLGIAYALFLHSLIRKRDNANMLGSATIMLTSLLAGGFSLAVRHAPVIDAIRDVLPQKRLMDFVSALENGVPVDQYASLGYVIGFAAVLFTVSWLVIRRRYMRAL
jgi:ABC-2 type transport system permease protein